MGLAREMIHLSASGVSVSTAVIVAQLCTQQLYVDGTCGSHSLEQELKLS